MATVRLQHLQWLGALIVAACCLVMGGVVVQSSHREYAVYDEGARELRSFSTVAAAAVAVAAERGPANVAMTAAPADEAASFVALTAKRAEVDARIDEAERALGGGGAGGRADALVALRAKLAEGRAAVDGAVRAHTTEATLAAIEAMFAAADTAQAAYESIGRTIVAAAPRIGVEVSLAAAAASLRDHAGRLGSQVVAMLVTESDGDAARFHRALEEAGELDGHLRLLLNLGKPYFGDGPVGAAIDAVERDFFGKGLPWALDVARDQSGGRRLTVGEFTRTYVPTLKSVEELRVAMDRSSGERLAAFRDAAWFQVVASGALTATVCLILLVIALLFRHALFRPLIEIRDQVAAIAGGDFADPRRLAPLGREIREMFDGIDVLRAEQIQKRELEERQLEFARRLKELAETDALTGLLNRRAIEAMAADALAKADHAGAPVAVVLFDIDRFKTINDGFGHAAGDAVLKAVASAARAELRPGDRLARVGGEEFAALVPGATRAEAGALAERLRRAVAGLALAETAGLTVTGSFGVAFRPAGSDLRWEALVASADRRLYAAKAAGRNRVVTADAPAQAARTSGDGSEAAA